MRHLLNENVSRETYARSNGRRDAGAKRGLDQKSPGSNVSRETLDPGLIIESYLSHAGCAGKESNPQNRIMRAAGGKLSKRRSSHNIMTGKGRKASAGGANAARRSKKIAAGDESQIPCGELFIKENGKIQCKNAKGTHFCVPFMLRMNYSMPLSFVAIADFL